MNRHVFFCILLVLAGTVLRFGLTQLHHKEFKLFLLLFVIIIAAFLWALTLYERKYPTYNQAEDQFSGGLLDA